MKKRVLLCFAEAIKRADARSTTQQAQYKRYFDRAAQVAPAYEAGQYVFVNRPPKRALTEDERTSVEVLGRNKLLTKAYGPFKVLSSTPETVTIDEQGIPNIISNDRVRLAPSSVAPAQPSGTNDHDPQTQRTSSQDARTAPLE